MTEDYDRVPNAYAHANETGLFNAWYERPEMLRMAGDVTGLSILDPGCGHGPLAAELLARGATVSGFDLSPDMIALARERVGPEADLRVADLAAPLPYPDDDFDLVAVSLTLHYIKDWGPTLAEIHRVLRPGGRLLVSLIHPFVYAATYPDRDYFDHTRYSEDYDFDGTPFVMTYWHRPLEDVIASFLQAGFAITELTEPELAPDTPSELIPPAGRRFISFLFIACRQI